MTSLEFLLQSSDNRFTLLPIKFPVMYKFFKDHEAGFWTTEEINLKDDIVDWETKLNSDEKFFIENILAFFAGSDGIVNENLIVNFYNDVKIPEARAFYTMQMMIESIHQEVYSVLIDSFVKDSKKKNMLFNGIQNVKAVQRKAEWALKWIVTEEIEKNLVLEKYMKNPELETCGQELINVIIKHRDDPEYINSTFRKRLLAFILVEGLFFSGSFCAIFWLKNRGLMPGLCFSNELISRDEAIHTDFGIYLYSLLDTKLPQEEVYSMFTEAVNIEKEFITESLPVSLIGMNKETMSEYIEFVANRLLSQLGYEKYFSTKECPFQFMELISFSGGNSKVNFFEKRNADYSKARIGSKEKELELSFDEDF